jgi:Fe-S cluster assembly protein SufD
MNVLAGTKRELAGVERDVAATEPFGWYLEDFARAEERLAGATLPWLQALRRKGLRRFTEIGFPTVRDEDWKYTDLTPLKTRNFRIAQRSGPSMDTAAQEGLGFPGLRAHELVFIDGFFSESYSRPGPAAAGLRAESLARTLGEDPGALKESLVQRLEKPSADAFTALNTAFLTGGAYLQVAAGVSIELPIHLLFISTGAEELVASHPRVVISVGANAQVKVIETYTGLGEHSSLTNALTEIHAGQNATVEHYRVQKEGLKGYHIGKLLIQQRRDSRVVSHSIALGAALSRVGIDVDLAEEGAEVVLNGLYMAQGRQHVDHHTRIDHLKPHSRSEEFYKGVLGGHARGVFNGKVIVHEGAQKTDARQSNKNLLLSPHAEADTKPELQIYADDVKCSHGATVGQLDETALFYLRSRGIDHDTARALLTYAFADDVISRIDIDPIRTSLERGILGQLPASHSLRDLL